LNYSACLVFVETAERISQYQTSFVGFRRGTVDRTVGIAVDARSVFVGRMEVNPESVEDFPAAMFTMMSHTASVVKSAM